MQQPIWIFGERDILEYMNENYLIEGTLNHKNNSAWEHGGIEVVKKEIEPY